jgi:arsenite methyltransferase
LIERYGDVAEAEWWSEYGERPLVLDAGCGAALSALELLGPIISDLRYVGVDISSAVDVAASRFTEHGLGGAFLQADVTAPPFAAGSVDVIFSEGVLHHTDSTEMALKRLAELLRPGGRFLFYVYRRKGPIREFTDDYVRERLQALEPQDAWGAVMPITKLGRALGDLDVEVEIDEPIELLGIPAGRISVQRLFYWHVLKAFHRPEMTLEEMNHINFDWFAPANAHRQSPEEVRTWCDQAGLDVERESVQPAGITVVARKRA